MIKLSVCILAKNEENNILDCINSVKSFADEIIVVDNGSTDRTSIIAKSLGAKVIFLDKFTEAQMRNRYLEEAKYDWTFAIDADERGTEIFGKLLKEKLSTVNDKTLALKVPINNYFGSGKWANFLVYRVIKTKSNIYYTEGDIHPSIVPSIIRANSKIEVVPAEIHHLDALIKGRSFNKRSVYTTKLKNTIDKTTDLIEKCRLTVYLGIEYTSKKDYITAKQHYEYVIKKLPNHAHTNFARLFLIQNYILMNNILLAKEELQTLIGNSNKEVLWNEDNNYVREKMAEQNNLEDDILQRCLILFTEISYQEGNYLEAIFWCKNALNMWPFLSHHYINLLALTKDKNDKKELYVKALEINPFLKEKLILKQVDEPNLYAQQTSVISAVNLNEL